MNETVFNQAVFDQLVSSGASRLLAWTLESYDPVAGTAEICFNPDERFLNPSGVVQGGFVAAMLDEAMGPAFVGMSDFKLATSSIDLAVSFIRPVRSGRLTCRSRVIKAGRSIVFLESELFDEEDRLLARATSSAVPVPIPQ